MSALVRLLHRNRFRLTSGFTLAIMLSMLASPLWPASAGAEPVVDGDNTVTTSEVSSALNAAGNIVGQSDSTVVASDSDSAITAQAEGVSVDIPKDPSEGVSLGMSGGPQIAISLPNADGAADAQKVAPGVVAYAADNGSASAVQAAEDGTVRMLTVIDNTDAPTAYDYKVTVPDGGHVELAPDGSALVLDDAGQIVATAATPWAKDANGQPVATYFTTDGTTLTQHVAHNVPGTAYPVTADPWWAPARVDHIVWVNTPWGRSLHVYMTWYGYTTSFVVPGTAFNEVMQKAGIGWSGSMYNQFVCHADLAPPWKESWNLDTWRPDVGLLKTIAKRCNP